MGTRGAAPAGRRGLEFQVPTEPLAARGLRPRDRETRRRAGGAPSETGRETAASPPEGRGRDPNGPATPPQERVTRPWALAGRAEVFVLQAGRAALLGPTVMILPQVHLRKPCYDFYFL